MKIVICDDSPSDVNHIVKLIKGRYSVSVFLGAEQLVAELEDNRASFDLYILDIIMEDMSGIELARKIRQSDEKALICFTSSSNEFYRDAYDVYAFQYLLKPVTEDAFNKMLSVAADSLNKSAGHCVTLSYHGKTVRVPYDNILFIESKGHNLIIHCKNGITERQTGQLGDFEKQLDAKKFFRVHQSFIINIYNMDALLDNSFICCENVIPISRKYNSVKEKYRKALFEVMG